VNGAVLIADGNGERAQRIAAACQELGIQSRVVPHGAAALETALAMLPEVLVVDRDLPLIEGEKLGEILRTNPRTQSVRLLFLAHGASEAGEGEGDVRTIRASAAAADIAASVRALIAKQAEQRRGAAPSPVDAGGGIEGDLGQLPLSDLLQLFHVSRKTGAVSLVRREADGSENVGQVLVSGGDVVHAAVGPVSGEKALLRLLAWERGSFTFRPEPIAADPTIQTPTLALLREGRRQRAEWERMATRLPPPDARVTLKIQSSSLPNVIHPLTQEVLLALEHNSRVADILDQCSHPDYQVLRMLHTLVRRGMVDLRRDVPGPGGTPAQAGLFSPNQAARLRDWLDGSAGGPVRDAKVVVGSSSTEALREFARVMSRLPGVRLSDAALAGDVPRDEIASLGRIAVDDAVGLEFVQVPVSPGARPLWPLAAHGSLAVLMLLAGPLTEAVDAVQAVAADLRRSPRTRLFHLLLLEKGQGLSPETMRENMSLLDEGSLFLVPRENASEAGILLREMFGRILP
jgi:CheY-like chemotaxis protein